MPTHEDDAKQAKRVHREELKRTKVTLDEAARQRDETRLRGAAAAALGFLSIGDVGAAVVVLRKALAK